MFDRSVLVGMVFDLSLNHAIDGQRNIDIVKNVLIKKILDTSLLTKIYVSHDDWLRVPKDQGESTFFVISYQESKSFSVDKAFKRAINVVGECQEDCDKYVFLITDRFQANINFQYKKAFLSNDVRGFETKINVFGLGEVYDKLSLANLVEEFSGKFFHSDNVNQFEGLLTEVLIGGSNE